MRTYPPRGKALTPYSVSPRRNAHRRGPNPTKNSSTLILNAFATAKCAASWMRITRRMATTNTTIPTVPDISGSSEDGSRREKLPRGEQLGGPAAGPGVGPLQAHHRHDRRGLVLVDDRRDHLADPGEGDPAVEEHHDRDLVGRVHGGRVRRAQPAHAVGEVERREGLAVDRLEGQLQRRLDVGEAQRLDAPREP